MQPNCDNDQFNIMVLKIHLIYIILNTFNIDDSNSLSILMHRYGYETYCCYTHLIVVNHI